MNKKKGMVLFVFFVFLVGIVSNVRGKAENENGSDAVKSIENQENNSQETESLDNDLSQKDILEVVLEKEILPVKEEKDEPAELVCCDEGKQQEGLIGSGLHDGYGKNRWGEYCRCGE